MIASELISKTISPLRTSDIGEEALTMMNVYHVKHLPVVNNSEILGLVSEEDILSNDLDEAIGSYELSLLKPYSNEKDHLFEVMSLMAKHKLTVVPVVDREKNFLGLITQEDLMAYFSTRFSFEEPGSIVVLETTKSNYSLAEISRIVEEESAAILTSVISSQRDSELIDITLKINKVDILKIINSFQRYDYSIKASFSEAEFTDTLKDRYDSLMNYLNV